MRKRYIDLVDGPRAGERIEIPWGMPTFNVHDTRTPMTVAGFEDGGLAKPIPMDVVTYLPMERGETQRGRLESGLEYQIEQWSVDGKREEYHRHFWRMIAESNRQALVTRTETCRPKSGPSAT
jgi:hypothetical protein